MTDRPGPAGTYEIHRKWGWFVALGAVLVVLGSIAFANLMVATIVSVFYVGVLMLAGGILHLVHAFQVKGWDNVLFWALSGVLYTLAAFLTFRNPDLTAAVLTLFLALALLVAGLFRIWLGVRIRPQSGAGWIVFGGAITVLAGLVIAVGWPVNSLWVLGLFLAVDLIFQGWALIAFGTAMRR